MGLWRQIKKGVKAGIMAMRKQSIGGMPEAEIRELINQFLQSPERKEMLIGERYYKVKNKILYRKIYKELSDGRKIELKYRANHKLAHATYKNMVDEKLQYLFAKPYTLQCEDEAYVENVKKALGKSFQSILYKLGYQASNKGTGWLHPYVTENGELKFKVFPSEQLCPIWTDSDHEELAAMIRIYTVQEWSNGAFRDKTNIEIHKPEGPEFYVMDGDYLFAEERGWNELGEPVGYWSENGEEVTWEKVPFIPFKNNLVEMPDISFVRTLLDEYDLTRSEAANYIEDVKALIWILKGYSGTSVEEFFEKINDDRIIPLDGGNADDGVETITPSVDVSALVAHYEQLKKDILEGGQAVNKDTDKMGSAPSGIALQFLYAGLDMKCNALETSFKEGFNQLLYFINKFYNISDPCEDLTLVLNRDIKVNETEKITNLNSSRPNISEKTYLAQHPYVSDVEKEMDAIKEETSENNPFKDKVPIIGDLNE